MLDDSINSLYQQVLHNSQATMRQPLIYKSCMVVIYPWLLLKQALMLCGIIESGATFGEQCE